MQMIERLSNRVKKLSLSEIGILKICVAAFALLVGAYNARKVKKYSLPLFVTFALSAAYLAIRIYFEDDEDEDDDFDFDFDFDFDDDDDEAEDEYIDPMVTMEICAENPNQNAVSTEAQSEEEASAPSGQTEGEAPADADVQDSENEPE